ncbi:TonB-dependent receptor-like protein [Anaerospora hongkongensis]|uniref:TonB-dependent receptor-like protein n=1 Tax=Anaerospora hongkongensis TaxID=244830 RepID=A0A4V2Q8X6_9FIRM|nr:TonB-dependent receptor [Anaerospora hongkongensis]TCL39104.1 TonB-dependent receptor-like protein [Anaerospora hongkongensis]
MKQHRLKRKALAISIACALALTWTPDYSSSVYAAEAGGEHSQETKETVNADGKAEQEYSLESITVEAKRPDWESKLSPGTVTIIRPDDYKGEQKTLPDLLKDVPGVHVREVNGKGQYTTVSVRGSTAAQVGVFVDGVLFNLGGDAAADISTIPVKNVERIEVYRGYIPARFGGTYIGGVINIVTKRPTQSNVSASVGQSSWGGYTGSLQVDSPLGTGSLMVGINRDQSEGDFRYKNFSSDFFYAKEMPPLQEELAMWIDFTNSNIASHTGANPNFVTAEDIDAAFDNPANYNHYLNAALDNYYKFRFSSKEEMMLAYGWTEQRYYDEVKTVLDNERIMFRDATAETREKIGKIPKDATRWRKNNDYKNTDAIIKWQDDHWLAKATWKKIDRHLSEGLWAGLGYSGDNTHVDLDDSSSLGPRRQELTAKELLVGRRDTVGKMEWGWSVNYLDQNKDYRNDRYDPVIHENDHYFNHPLRIWSSYDSRRVGGAIDGSYEAGNGHLLEFMANLSKEKMDIDGSGITNFIAGEDDWLRRFRNYYEQTLFNIQLQDTITLNKAEDLWFTPSVRYNSSTVLGRSTRLIKEHNNHIWFNQEDEQQDSKVTWQAALKKKVSDKLTLRSTYGTYYRLLNLYEIAGDGAGIMPRPIYDKDFLAGLISAFPLPEEGTQWDVSAIWDDRMLGADGNIQLTYFGRKSENMLQLYRFGLDYWSYSNAARGRVNGAELQTKLSWDKWDMNLATTYTHVNAQRKYNNPGGTGETYYDMPVTYLPEWEGSMRLTYRPDQKTSVFTELKYMDKMFVSDGFEWQQKALTTVGLGVKHKFTNDLQMTVGVNDLFNKGPELRLVSTGLDYNGDPLPPGSPTSITYPLNTDNPTQGRTYYVTMQYKY